MFDELLEKYDAAWSDYKKLEENEQAFSSYCAEYIFSENNLGLNETINHCRKKSLLTAGSKKGEVKKSVEFLTLQNSLLP